MLTLSKFYVILTVVKARHLIGPTLGHVWRESIPTCVAYARGNHEKGSVVVDRNRFHPGQFDPNTRATILFEMGILLFLGMLWLMSR